jgi:hypothetical protein
MPLTPAPMTATEQIPGPSLLVFLRHGHDEANNFGQ